MDDNNSRKVNSTKSNKSNKSTDEDAGAHSSEKPKQKCAKCGKWGYHTAEDCKVKDSKDDKRAPKTYIKKCQKVFKTKV